MSNEFLDGDRIKLPSTQEQAKIAAMARAREITKLIDNLVNHPPVEIPLGINEGDFSKAHLLPKERGWQPPEPELVQAYFEQLKRFDSRYTDQGIAELLGLSDGRNIRRFKSGERPVPFDIWQRFLVATGRAPIPLPTIIGFFS